MSNNKLSKEEKIEILEKNIDYIYKQISTVGNYTLEGLHNASIALKNFETLKICFETPFYYDDEDLEQEIEVSEDASK